MKNLTITLLTAMAIVAATDHALGQSTFDLNKNQPFGNSWNTAADWDLISGPGPAPPVAGDTANTNGFNLRTPSSSNTFAATLNIDAAVLLKTTGTATIADGNLLGGGLNQAISPNSTGTFAGNINVGASSTISLASTATDIRTMILTAVLSGTGNLTVDGGNGAGQGTLDLSTTNNAGYSGDWLLKDNARILLPNSGNNRLGTGDITLTGDSLLQLSNGDGNASRVKAGTLAGNVIIQSGQMDWEIPAGNGGGSPHLVNQLITIDGLADNSPGGAQLQHDIQGSNVGVGRDVYYENIQLTAGSVLRIHEDDGGSRADLTLLGDAAVSRNTTADGNDNFDLSGVSSSGGAHTLSIGQTGGSEATFNTTLYGDVTNTNLSLTNAVLNVTDGGTHTVTGNITDGGTSSLNVDEGTVNITGGLSVDNLTVAADGGNGKITATGGAVSIGSGAGNNMAVAGTAPNSTADGIADFSGATSVTINVGNLEVGTQTDNNGTSTRGDLLLSSAGVNNVTAATILVANSPGGGNTGGTSLLALGGSTNNINVDTLTIGGEKSNAELTIGAGGTLALGGNINAAADLRIGYNNASGTGSNTTGSMDLSGAIFNSTLDDVIIGLHAGGGSGSGSGTLTMDDGTVTANSILLAEPGGSSNPSNTKGIFNFNGGTLTAGLIDDGGGDAQFNFNGGTLHVDQFGFDLVQNGGVLDAEGSPGLTEILGNYTQNTGILQVDITGNDPGDQSPLPPGDDNVGFDLYVVSGAAELLDTVRVDLQDGYWPGFGTTFNIVTADSFSSSIGDINFEFLLDGAAPDRNLFSAEIVPLSGGGQALQLTSLVPEPATLLVWSLLAGLGLGMGWRRRKR